MQHVFLSYKHETPEHAAAVRHLAQRLREARIPVELDQFFLEQNPGGPDEGWPKWCEDRAVQSCCVLIVASQGWFDAYENKGSPSESLGAAEEAAIFRQDIYERKGVNVRIRLALLHELDDATIPIRLRGFHRFRPLAEAAEFEQLVSWIRQRIEAKGPSAPLPAVSGQGSGAALRAALAPDSLADLCDRSDQEGRLGTLLSRIKRQDLCRPLLLVVHGESREVPISLVERLARHYLPWRLKTLGFTGESREAWQPTKLISKNADDFASEIREKITRALQYEAPCGSDEELRQCFVNTRARVIFPIFDFSSSEAFGGEKSYVEMLAEYWSAFPELPSGLAVVVFICIKYVEPESSGFVARLFSRRNKLEELRQAIERFQRDTPHPVPVRVIHDVLPELKPVTVEDVDRWFQSPEVSRHLPRSRRLHYDGIKSTIFKNRAQMPMDDVITELNKYLSAGNH